MLNMMRRVFRSFFQNRTREQKRGKLRTQKRTSLIQQLETRQMLAGDVNHPPAAIGGWIALDQSQARSLSLNDIGYSDHEGDAFNHLTIHALPEQGSLTLYDYPLYAGQSIWPMDLEYGNLQYLPNPVANSSYLTTFSFTVSDGVDSSQVAALHFSVSVTPNLPPEVIGASHSLQSTEVHTLSMGDIGYSDAEGDSLQSITVIAAPMTGTLEYYGYPV